MMKIVLMMILISGNQCRFVLPPEAVWGIIETYNNEKIKDVVSDSTYKESEVIETVHPSERGIEMVPVVTEPEDVEESDTEYFYFHPIFAILCINLLFSIVIALLFGFIALVIKMIRNRIGKKLEEDPEAGRRPLSDLPGPVLWAPLPAPLHEITLTSL